MLPRPPANPPNPFSALTLTYDGDEGPSPVEVHLYDDATRQILSENDSPDLGFRYSVNPYRGCMHACAYCYARPTHEYLDFGAGTDFDTKIVVKRQAPALLRAAFERPSWRGELVAFSGVTDCYQPVERELGITRRCLEVCHEFRNPVSVITKGALIERDLDVLAALHRDARVQVMVSVTFADAETARAIEPWVPTPARRLRVIETMASAGVPVGVMVAPVIPGLNDGDMVEILERARAAGASHASLVLLRLPGSVLPVFEERLRQTMPLRADKVLARVREVRGGKSYDSRFFKRQQGTGPYADAIHALFETTARRLGYAAHQTEAPPPPTTFRRPPRPSPQLTLFS
jgi:DNA repair photolyase